MSDIYPPTISRAEPIYHAPLRPRHWSRWPKRIVVFVFLLWVACEGISLTIQHTRLRRILTARIEAAFGRPVEVESYDFSLWHGPALDANSVTVGEDPRFGHEYFLRAESMTVRLRWASLLRGHIELGTLSLTRPSLNLVRNAAGDWNLGEWLPQPAGDPSVGVPVGPSLPSSAVLFRRIEVEGGRINFKNGDEKLPLAFVGVKGTVETDRPGRWIMNLDATPWRAAVVVQQAGTIHLSGDLGGTSSRLRPAALDISWTDASISDVLRLAGGNDDGIRGALALAINARTREQDDGWAIQGRAELRQVHRWDLALRPDTPSLNLIAQTTWHPAAPEIEFNNVALEAPHSSAHASGRIRWNSAVSTAAEKSPPVQFTVSSLLDLSDVLPWLRAFHPGIAESISVRGRAEVQGEVSADALASPPHLTNATVSSAGVDFSGADLRRSAHVGQLQLHYDRGQIFFPPMSLSWGPAAGPSDGQFRLDASAKQAHSAMSGWHIAGSTRQARDLIAGAAALGWNLSRGWDLAGPFACDLRGPEAPYSWQGGGTSQPVGWVEFGGPGSGAGPVVGQAGDSLRAPFLNQPIDQIRARAEWKPGARHIALTSAQAFGARWSGTFDRRDKSDRPGSSDGWQFFLAADHLSAAELDRWLNPAWRQSFLDRVLPFLNSRAQSSAAPESLRASGRLTLDQFTLEPLVVHHLQGDLKIDGRHVALADAVGQFYGGQVAGSLDANLSSTPAYRADLNFSRIDGAAFVAATPALLGLTANSVDGQISISAAGANRSDLLASLTCQGKASVSLPKLLNVDIWNARRSEPPADKFTIFHSADASFSCARRKIEFQSMSLSTGPDTSAIGSGTVDFSRNLDLRVQMLHSMQEDDKPGPSVVLTGTLAAPIVQQPQPAPRRSR